MHIFLVHACLCFPTGTVDRNRTYLSLYSFFAFDVRFQTSGQPLDLDGMEESRPSVFVLNHANAHTGKFQVTTLTV